MDESKRTLFKLEEIDWVEVYAWLFEADLVLSEAYFGANQKVIKC